MQRNTAAEKIIYILEIQSSTQKLNLRKIFERYDLYIDQQFEQDMDVAQQLYEQIYQYHKTNKFMMEFIQNMKDAVIEDYPLLVGEETHQIFTPFNNICVKLVDQLTSSQYTRDQYSIKQYRYMELKDMLPISHIIDKYDYYIHGRVVLSLENTIIPVHRLLQVHDKLISTLTDNTLEVWNLKTGEQMWTLMGHTRQILQVIYLNADMIITICMDGSFKIWNINTGICENTVVGDATCVALISDNTFVTGSEDGSLKIWDFEGNLEEILTHHTEIVTVIAVSIWNNKQYIITGSIDLLIKIWDVDTLKVIFNLTGHETTITKIISLGRKVISGSYNGLILIHDLLTGKLLASLHGHTKNIVDLKIIHSRWIVSASTDGTVKIWDLENGQLKSSFLGNNEWIGSIDILPDNSIVVGLGGYPYICIIQNNNVIYLHGHTNSVEAVLTLKDGRIVSGSHDASIKIWE